MTRASKGPRAVFAKLLTVEDERKLLAAVARKDRRARDKIILAFLPLAYKIAKKYVRYGLSIEDLKQEATVGIIKAVDRFDGKTFKNRFGPYAKWWIKAELDNFARRNWSIVRNSSNRHVRNNRILPDLITSRGGFDVSLNDPFKAAEGDGDYQDRLLDDAAPADEVYADRQASAIARADIEIKLAMLPLRTRDILKARWWTEDEPKTFEELGARYGVSRERIRQIEVDGLARIGVPAGSVRVAEQRLA